MITLSKSYPLQAFICQSLKGSLGLELGILLDLAAPQNFWNFRFLLESDFCELLLFKTEISREKR